MPQIDSDKLRLQDVPPDDAGWGDLSEFALTFNGYTFWGSEEACEEVATSGRYDTIDELRTCLFHEERCSRHSDADEEASIDAMRAIVELIREKIKERDEA